MTSHIWDTILDIYNLFYFRIHLDTNSRADYISIRLHWKNASKGTTRSTQGYGSGDGSKIKRSGHKIIAARPRF